MATCLAYQVPPFPHQQVQRALAQGNASASLVCYSQCRSYGPGNCTANCMDTPIVTTLPPDSPLYPTVVTSIKQACYSRCLLSQSNECAASCNFTAINATSTANFTRPIFTLPSLPSVSLPLPPSFQLLNSTQLRQCYDMLALSLTQSTKTCMGLPPWADSSHTPVFQAILTRDFCEVAVQGLYNRTARFESTER